MARLFLQLARAAKRDVIAPNFDDLDFYTCLIPGLGNLVSAASFHKRVSEPRRAQVRIMKQHRQVVEEEETCVPKRPQTNANARREKGNGGKEE